MNETRPESASIFEVRRDVLARLERGHPFFLEVHGEIGSTNDRAKVLGASGAPAWTAVLALRQSKPRPLGARIPLPEGGVYLSLCCGRIAARPTPACLPPRRPWRSAGPFPRFAGWIAASNGRTTCCSGAKSLRDPDRSGDRSKRAVRFCGDRRRAEPVSANGRVPAKTAERRRIVFGRGIGGVFRRGRRGAAQRAARAAF